MAIVASNVKYCITIFVFSHWVTVLFNDEVPYHLLQAIVSGVAAELTWCVVLH